MKDKNVEIEELKEQLKAQNRLEGIEEWVETDVGLLAIKDAEIKTLTNQIEQMREWLDNEWIFNEEGEVHYNSQELKAKLDEITGVKQ